MIMEYEFGFIGCGNMGGALASACLKSVKPKKIAVCDYDEQKVNNFKALGAKGATAQEIAANARFIVLGVKPQVMESALSPIAQALQQRTDAVIITMGAGVSISAIRSFIGADLPVIRIMPNTPALVGEAMILYSVEGVDEREEKAFLKGFAMAGKFDKIPESEIDAASALSGCGPAFVYAFARGLVKGACKSGVPEDKAFAYTAQTLIGAAKMLSAYGDPDTLIKNVCSPGGTTIEGIKALEKADFDNITASAVTAAYKRTLELKK
ncbi:MAG: pyrroline-5-carboxylate reductase [Clostridia bacterium]|nr:pyrroline-5-carboxylate reductase [Clostridia bacterium]